MIRWLVGISIAALMVFFGWSVFANNGTDDQLQELTVAYLAALDDRDGYEYAKSIANQIVAMGKQQGSPELEASIAKARSSAKTNWDNILRERAEESANQQGVRQSLYWGVGGSGLLSILICFFAYNFVRNRALQLSRDRLESEVEERTAAMRKALESAELAAKSKREFLARANHEVRSPLQAIIGYSELMQNRHDFTEEQQDQFLSGIVASGEHLMSLVNDVIEITKIENGVLQLDEQDFQLREVITDVYEILIESAHSKGLDLTLDISGCGDIGLYGDDTILRQILINLLSNAIKFTSDGHVGLTAITVESENCVDVMLKVHDTGPGIAPELQSRVFQPFADLPMSNLGKGLGLYITKSLVDFVGGEISFQSGPGEGTQFNVNLSFSRQRSKNFKAQSNSNRSTSLKTLVIDDKVRIRELVCITLSRLGHNAEHCEKLEDAIGWINEWKPNVVFLDLRMPGKSGFDFLADIRSTCHHHPIMIAMTGDTTVEVRQAAINAGFDLFLSKPFQTAQLNKLLNNVANSSAQTVRVR